MGKKEIANFFGMNLIFLDLRFKLVSVRPHYSSFCAGENLPKNRDRVESDTE